MKQVISDVNNIETSASLLDCHNPSDYKVLELTTKYHDARNPDESRTLFRMILSPDALAKLRAVLNS